MSDPLFRTGFRSPPALQKLLGRLMSWLTGRPLTWPAWAQDTWALLTGTTAADTARHAPLTLGELFQDTLPVRRPRPARPARQGTLPVRRQRAWLAARPPAPAQRAPLPRNTEAVDSPSAAGVRCGNWSTSASRRTGPRRHKH